MIGWLRRWWRPGPAVCRLCGMPAVERNGGWAHAEVADEAFCELLFGRGGRPAE